MAIEDKMFCYQCEQTAMGKGCSTFGVCGKSPDVSSLQDLLIYMLRGLSQLAVEGRKVGVVDEEVDLFICESAFVTLTNVNFDPNMIVDYIRKSESFRDVLLEKVGLAGGVVDFVGPVELTLKETEQGLITQGKRVGVKADSSDADLNGLRWLLIFGIKGVAAYAYHAYRFGKVDDKVFEFIEQGLAATLDRSLGVNDFVGLVLKCGEVNIRAMELLDAGNTERFGHPVPTKVPLGHKKGKAILVSGHDLKDLEEVLKQSEGKGVFVYTHGEMLPGHGYPKLKKYSHLYGHYGTAWQNQQKEFNSFPGAILMTTNCIQKPKDSYKDNIFTTGPVGYPGVAHVSVPHVETGDFSAVIKKALEMPGFSEDKIGKIVSVGFGRNTVLGLKEEIVEAVMKGHINSFFLVAGCDGAKPGRNYYTEFVEKSPKDSVILTLACGKFRFFDKDLGEIDGIPRLLDIGQCNDAYSAVKIAQAFGEVFQTDINGLPLFFILSWYEQKAVAILLSLFYLGVKNIRLGPSLPAFITPNVLKVLVENFNIMPIKTPDEDLKTIIDYVNGVDV